MIELLPKSGHTGVDYMIKRKIEKELQRFYESSDKKALLITGARQVGKTYIIRDFAEKHYES